MSGPVTVARVNMAIYNNASWEDAFQFDSADNTTWDFVDKSFVMNVKGSKDDPDPLFVLSTDNDRIKIDDTALRVLHFDVLDTDIVDSLPPNEYVYDLVMIDESVSPNIRTVLMTGKVCVKQGVTRDT